MKFIIITIITNIFLISISNSNSFAYQFSTYSTEAVSDFRSVLLNEQKNYKSHRNYFVRYTNILPSFSPEYTETTTDENFKHFVANKRSFYWIRENSRVPCEIVRYTKESKDYLYEDYEHLRIMALEQLKAITESNESNKDQFNKLEQEYEKILQKLARILDLVEKAYPPHFSIPDRVVTYQFSLSEEFKSIEADPEFVPSGDIRVKKILFGNGQWIPLSTANGALTGYMNIISEPTISAPHLSIFGTDEGSKEYQVRLKREVSPLEACLSELKLEIIGDTGKVPYQEVGRVELSSGRGYSREDLSIRTPTPWGWGPATDPMNPNFDFSRIGMGGFRGR